VVEGNSQVEELYYEALRRQAGPERASYLDTACGQDSDLRTRIESLLKADEEAGDFLESPAFEGEATLGRSLVTEGPGSMIGPYKLLERIGEGGMAVVYMAEPAPSTRSALFGPASTGVLSDSEGTIRRKVALKIIKLGMDTHQVIARFEAERQALALMDHPSIAKVLDAGATETGRPYFVMELVQGASITECCDRNSLSTKDRLALFVQVCNAVQHAHQKGIIHRDIKPSNVMVTHHDGKPIPKVIDFGIAKATNQRLTEKTLFTRYAHLIGTPAYMSPEQAELSDLDIDTRTDIYSLGVLLYELLTGTTPFSEEELRKAGYIEMQRVIREQQPVKPSTRIRTGYVAQPPSAGGTGTTPEGGGATRVHSIPYQQVRGDLDWIVMKALEKDRARRYETPNSLASDILRHLEHEPVLARGPSVTYRAERFLRRHRSQVVLALVIAIVAVAAAVVFSLWNRDRAHLAEAEGFKHRGILSQAREQYAKAEREAALETIKPVLGSKHVGPDARLLQATILGDNRRSDEAVAILNNLLDKRPEVAGAAHSLLARILWESGSPDAEKLQEIEEHRKQAEALLFGVPPSGGKDQSDPRERGTPNAEAYFLRAMTALTVKEQLASLDKALELDSGHYESRRLRAYTYYASRKYDRLRDDALVMTILRPRDPLGYSLRAVAGRELGRYPEAIADYELALALTPRADSQYIDLIVQRSAVFLRMGEYERVIAEATAEGQAVPRVAGILPAIRGRDALDTEDRSPLQYHEFAALTALGEYDSATTLFREIISRGPEARRPFRDWCAKYVFDTLEAGQPWHPPDREPAGAAFLPMIEAEETYRSLSAKGHRLTTDGFTASWSPDGRRLAFSVGIHGYSGVAVFDPATKEIDLLIVPGKDPRWSPDGHYIAFVRDCQFLRVAEFTGAERRNQHRVLVDEEVWVMESDGTEPRCLAKGGWPSWGRDSTTVYYHSRADKTLCSISVKNWDAKPNPIMACSDSFPLVSPDNQHVACLRGTSTKMLDPGSQMRVLECPAATMTWGVTGWSPSGRELCLGTSTPEGENTGLWIYDLDGKELASVLNGQIANASWSPVGTDLAFCLGPPYYEIWTCPLDPRARTSKTLGPARTPEEHIREMVAFYTRRVKTDPEDAFSYASRATYYERLHDRERMEADMERSSAILGRDKSSGSPLGATARLRGIINGPFGYQLAFSVGEREHGIAVFTVVSGQKGRCEMKVLQVPLFAASLLGLSLLSGIDATSSQAEFGFGDPVNLGPAVNSVNTEFASCVSADELSLFLSSNRPPGGYQVFHLWLATRQTKGENWGTPVPLELGGDFNPGQNEWTPSLSADGLSLYFSKGWWNGDLWVVRRNGLTEPWGVPESLGSVVNSAGWEAGPSISTDELELFFCSTRSGGYGGMDLYVTTRASKSDPWGAPVNLGPTINTSYGDALYGEWGPNTSADGLALFFASATAGFSGQSGSLDDKTYNTRQSVETTYPSWVSRQQHIPRFGTVHFGGWSHPLFHLQSAWRLWRRRRSLAGPSLPGR